MMGFLVFFMMKFFKGMDIYLLEDILEVDYFIIMYDYYDYFDYGIVKVICDKVDKVICLFGVGEYFEYWGYFVEKIVEMDWNEVYIFEFGFWIMCLFVCYFLGWFFWQNFLLWVLFMFEGYFMVYIGGDSGYGVYFLEIGKWFLYIDFVIFENG